MRRVDYVELLGQVDAQGVYARLHWTSGPRAGRCDPWDGDRDSLTGTPRRPFGATCRETGSGGYFAEELWGTPRLVILGAGHVGRAVAQISSVIGFHTVVIDDRPGLARSDRLTGADQIVVDDYGVALRALSEHANSYFVVVTPGHRSDRECALLCLTRPHQYVGMIGSRRKAALVRRELVEAGLSPELTRELRSPIGVHLGGPDPGEIAVSICAELVQVRAECQGQVVDAEVADTIRGLARTPELPAVLATVIGDAGSTPRGTGARMVVGIQGPVAGSVGGGAVELEVVRRAQALLAEGDDALAVADYDLSGRRGNELDMICGGSVRVLLERL
ncbi:xanthine dehydrogenase accessory factor [Austwickia chelonae]|uniref:Xanthine dehydrogenase accessory factor n=2 Tax=Austwickia TaxID=1184606 RepID=K6UKQ4_9MICO|nr:hypothetical protein AUCHE_01_01680 [Austwickia chelonae NBRC 105200]SEW27866.1 xanthine dehydrogenase accessory factor [Austwickia chelonae]